MLGFILLLSQVLGHERHCCHLVGDKGTRAGFDYGEKPGEKTDLFKGTFIDYYYMTFVSADQLCALHWHHRHPGPEVTVPRYRWK